MKHLTLENKALSIILDEATGCFDVIERKSGQHWRRDPWEGSPGELVLAVKNEKRAIVFPLERADDISVTVSGAAARVSYSGLRTTDGETVIDGSVLVSFHLCGESPEFHIDVEKVAFDESAFEFESLLYPKRQFSLTTDKDDGYMAFPYNQGALIPSGRFKVPLRDEAHMWDDLSWESSGVAWGTEGSLGEIFVYGWSALTMPFYGAVRGDSSWVAVMETDMDLKVSFILNNNHQDYYNKVAQKSPYDRIVTASPRWLATKGQFGYQRRLRYGFFPGGTHVEMAKFYRKIAEKQGLIRTLKEKLKENAEVEKLFGASLINIDGGYPWYTDYDSMMLKWNDLKRLSREIHDDLRVKHAMICLWGGYSKLPPNTLPFHPEWGTEEELKEAMKEIRDLGYLYCTYHGYPANLPHSDGFDPDEATRYKDGSIGGRWGARCSKVFRTYAERDLPKIKEITGQTADYTDMLSSGAFRECYHPDHPVDRREDRRSRCDTLDYIRSLGLVNGSEVAQGYLVPHVDYTKGGMYVGKRYFLMQHIHLPLYNLVFHDCLVVYDSSVGISRLGEYSNEALECMAYGVHPVFSFNMAHYEGAKQVIKETSAMLSEFLRETATAELDHHEYLGGGYDVQRTRFSTGHEVFINTDTAPFSLEDGREVPARGYLVVSPDNSVKRGCIETHAVALDA